MAVENFTPAFLIPLVALGVGVLASATRLVLRRMLRRSPQGIALLTQLYLPAQVLLMATASRGVIAVTEDFEWRPEAAHGLLLAIVAATAWVLTRLMYVVRTTAERRYHSQAEEDVHHRHRRTQITVMYRAGYAGAWLVALGIMFMTFPAARTVGASLLASAGVAGVVVGMAAQTMLKNFFAGITMVFGDALRLGDLVQVDGEWGHIEDIELSYVVIKIWDERRLILPTAYFNDNAYRNWSRHAPAVLGTVELDVDWRLPMSAARAQLRRIVTSSPHWDGRVCSIVVLSATGPLKRIRPLISAADGDAQWYLRCEVREQLIEWIVEYYPECMPRYRIDTDAAMMAAMSSEESEESDTTIMDAR